jgi:integrase
MAHIEKRPSRRKPWRVRYRDPLGRERSRSFARKADADRFMATVQADLIRGDWTDPRLSKITVEEWAERWFRTKSDLKPKTLAGYRSNLQAHVIPAFAGYQLRHVDRMAVEEWVADLQASGLGPSGIRQARQVLNSMLTLAVDAGYLPSNPVEGVRTPRQPEPQMLFLDADEVERLADAIQEPYGTLVYLLAYGGLRWGEAVALRSDNVDVLRHRVYVRESATLVNGKLVWGTPKSHRSRTIVIPRFLMDELAPALSGGDLVFTSSAGHPLRSPNFLQRIWKPAVADIGLGDLVPHDLRHTAASLAISAGASVKAVQRMLGHSSAQITLDRYAHLFEDDLDSLAESMDARYSAAQVRPKRTSDNIVALPEDSGKADFSGYS